MRMFRKGKVKDLYILDNGNILFHFSDRVSAFDIKMVNSIPRKGEVLCRFARFWFDSLVQEIIWLGFTIVTRWRLKE